MCVTLLSHMWPMLYYKVKVRELDRYNTITNLGYYITMYWGMSNLREWYLCIVGNQTQAPMCCYITMYWGMSNFREWYSCIVGSQPQAPMYVLVAAASLIHNDIYFPPRLCVCVVLLCTHINSCSGLHK